MIKLLCVAAGTMLVAAPTPAAFRGSASFLTAPDGLTSGGGRSASASYIATQQAVGEIAGFTLSPSFKNQVGITQVDPVNQVPVTLSRFQLD